MPSDKPTLPWRSTGRTRSTYWAPPNPHDPVCCRVDIYVPFPSFNSHWLFLCCATLPVNRNNYISVK